MAMAQTAQVTAGCQQRTAAGGRQQQQATADRRRHRTPTAAAAGRRPWPADASRLPPAAAGRRPLPATCCRRGHWAMLELPRRLDLLRACGSGCGMPVQAAGGFCLPLCERHKRSCQVVSFSEHVLNLQTLLQLK